MAYFEFFYAGQVKKNIQKINKFKDTYPNIKSNKAVKDLEQAQSKFERLKNKGKLSPNDEAKWLEKIQKLNEKIEKENSIAEKGNMVEAFSFKNPKR